MTITILLGEAHPCNANSYSWVVSVYTDENAANEVCDKLNAINQKSRNIHDAEFDDEHTNFYKPFDYWYSNRVLQQLKNIITNAVPPIDKLEGDNYRLRYKCQTKLKKELEL